MLNERTAWTGFLGAAVALFLAAPARSEAAVNPAMAHPPPAALALPDLSVSMQAPAFTLGQTCNTGGPAIIFHLTVRNNGLAPSAAIMQQQAGVMIETSFTNGHVGSVWSVAAALPAIAAHSSVNVDVGLMPLTPASAMSGTHVFSVLINPIGVVKELSTSNNSASITVDVPNGFCAHRSSLTQPMPTLRQPMLTHPVATPTVQRKPLNAQGTGSVSNLAQQTKPMLTHPVTPPTQQSKLLYAQGAGSLSNLAQQTYDTLDFKITTGSDDLRSDSVVEVFVTFPDKQGAICALKRFNDDGWANGSTHEVPCQALVQPETLANIAKAQIMIKLHSCECSYFQTRDNWNIEQFWMGAYQSGSNVPPLCAFSASGDPLVRLKPDTPEFGAVYVATSYISEYPSHC